MKKRLLLVWAMASLIMSARAQSIKIGIVADCQYCDCNYSPEWNNDYRKSISRLQEAVDIFNSKNVDIVFHLGDFIDRDIVSYDSVLPIMEELKMPYYFVLGNHDFSVDEDSKKEVYKKLKLESPYYVIQKGEWLFVILDGTEVSPYHSNEPKEIALANQQMHHFEQLGRPQAKPWNGGVSETQLMWFKEQLTKADEDDLSVIVLCHFPVLPLGEVNLWNDQEVVQIIAEHPSVKAFFNGHHHPGNYAQSDNMHYLTFQAMARSRDENAFAMVELTNNAIKVEGFGREPSKSLILRK